MAPSRTQETIDAARRAQEPPAVVPLSTTEPTPPPHSQPYLLESDEFRAYLERRRAEAVTIVDTLDNEIERFQAEIRQRMERRNDLSNIISACDQALTIVPRPELQAPSIIEHQPGAPPTPLDHGMAAIVKDELGGER